MKLKNKRKNIAVSLLGIFLFPVIFQNLHVVRHHHHDIAFGQDNPADKENRGDFIFAVFHHDRHCPIIEYKFQINSLPGYFVLDSVCPGVVGSVNESNSEEPYRVLRSSKSPRAPPVPAKG